MADGRMTNEEALDKYHKLDGEMLELVNWFINASAKRAYYEGYSNAKRGWPEPDSDSWEPTGDLGQSSV